MITGRRRWLLATLVVVISLVGLLVVVLLPMNTGSVAAEAITILEEEAGAATYMDAGQTLDLSKARNAYNTIEKETDTYIIDSMSLPTLKDAR